VRLFFRQAQAVPNAASAALPDLGEAPELLGVRPWLNTPDSEPVTLARLIGSVVLIEFWTFACGNCQRTLPFLRRMHSQYSPHLQVVGIHTPELPFERPARNVEHAVRRHRLEFAVGLDNDFGAWDAYGNHYWPSLYLVDAAGHIRYTHIGEGSYRRTEAAIRVLLTEAQIDRWNVKQIPPRRVCRRAARRLSNLTAPGEPGRARSTTAIGCRSPRQTARRSHSRDRRALLAVTTGASPRTRRGPASRSTAGDSPRPDRRCRRE